MEPKNRPVLVIGLLGIFVSVLLTPIIFRNFFALTPITQEKAVGLWFFSGVFCFVSIYIAMNRLRWKQQIALIFLSLILLIGSDLMVRLVVVRFVPAWRDQVIQHGVVAYPDQWKFRAHPFLQYVGNHNWLLDSGRFNITGFRGKELDHQKLPNVIRIACLGGSTTATGYPEKMEQYLNNRQEMDSVRFEVLNFGMSGYSSAHSLINFVLNVIDYSPDYIVFHHAWNDKMAEDKESFQTVNFRSDYSHLQKSFTPPSSIDLFLIRMSVIYRELKYLISPYDGWTYFEKTIHKKWPEEYLPPSQYPSMNNLQTYWRNIKTVIDVATARYIYPVMTTQPHSTDPQVPRYKEVWFIDAANETMRNGVNHYNGDVIFIDLDKEITGKRNNLFRDLGHMNKEGIQLKAEIIGNKIYNHALTERFHPK